MANLTPPVPSFGEAVRKLLPREWVASFAMSFHRVARRQALTPQYVFSVRNGLKVLRIAAGVVATQVVYIKVRGNRSIQKRKDQTMGVPKTPFAILSVTEPPIPSCRERAGPVPAIKRTGPFGHAFPESFDGGSGKHSGAPMPLEGALRRLPRSLRTLVITLFATSLLAACAPTVKLASMPPPPPALVAPLPPPPQVPTEATDAAVGAYIVALRDFGRIVSTRFEALKAWAINPKD